MSLVDLNVFRIAEARMLRLVVGGTSGMPGFVTRHAGFRQRYRAKSKGARGLLCQAGTRLRHESFCKGKPTGTGMTAGLTSPTGADSFDDSFKDESPPAFSAFLLTRWSGKWN
jgi:hypothetical protein